jgi:outer membrane protein W
VHASLGLGVSSKSVPSVYADFVEDDFTEIEQNLKLRVVPLTATVRFLPLGSNAAVQPYLGAGVGIFSWRYSESGEFIDFAARREIYRSTFADSGATAGPVILGGLSFPVGSWLFGGEVRYQSAQGELDADQLFSGNKIDLGGFTYSAMFKVRF